MDTTNPQGKPEENTMTTTAVKTSKSQMNPSALSVGVCGERFLQLAKADEFALTTHALDRLEDHLGFRPTRALAHHFFGRARQVRIETMRLMGYRPAYEARALRGEPTWYFRFQVFGDELVAVVTEGDLPGSYVWVTSYAPNGQMDRCRMVEQPAGAAWAPLSPAVAA
jgi:hypothetical protein